MKMTTSIEADQFDPVRDLKPLVYIAGPISSDPHNNTHTGMKMWDLLHRKGMAPIAPHWSGLQQMAFPLPYDTWILHDFQIIARCDALLRLPGESKGADLEVQHARNMGVPVFFSLKALEEWAERWSKTRSMKDPNIVGYRDDPSLDATEAAHPAWRRGEAYGTQTVLARIEQILDGHDDGSGVIENAQLEALRRRLLALTSITPAPTTTGETSDPAPQPTEPAPARRAQRKHTAPESTAGG